MSNARQVRVEGGKASLTLSAAAELTHVGACADYGTCRSTRKVLPCSRPLPASPLSSPCCCERWVNGACAVTGPAYRCCDWTSLRVTCVMQLLLTQQEFYGASSCFMSGEP